MKKFILPLIIVLILSFTLIGNCAWLAGWDKRIEIEIADYAGDIGAEVVWFPVDVFLTATQAEEVFVELTTDAEYKKMQFTQADGTSLLYGHMKLFDVSEELGVFTVSATGWTINSNDSVFVYYDKDHADNDTYIGATNTAACEAVYNAEYVAAYPMDDGVDNAHIYDATDNNNDGTKVGANEPIEATGKVSKGQSFDGTNDYIGATGTIPSDANFSLSALVCLAADTGTDSALFSQHTDNSFVLYGKTDYGTAAGKMRLYVGAEVLISTIAINDGVWRHISLTRSGDDYTLYINGASDNTGNQSNSISAGTFYTSIRGDIDKPAKTVIDEVHISSSARSAAWTKAEYNSSWDTLLTYGSEEEVSGNAIWFGMNF